jgi:RNA polymerase sigma-70 factor (ECF subfamily)
MKMKHSLKPIQDTVRPKSRHVYLSPPPDSPIASDAALWAAFKHGDPEAFRHLYSIYFPVLFNYGGQFTHDREVVKDLIQDLFIDLNERKERLADVKNIKFYLFKSLKTRILGVQKKSQLFDFPDFLQQSTMFGVSVSAESDWIDAEAGQAKVEALQKAYEQLTNRQREVLMYHFYEGLSYAQITELMGFSKEEHARKLVYRAVCKLRSAMQGKGFWLFSVGLLAFLLALLSMF